MPVWQSKITAGVTKLSQLEIDVDKDWLGHVIKNLGTPVDANDSLRKSDLDSHATAATGVHGVGSSYIAKTSRSDQLVPLSELVIDADKDWGGHVIKNLGTPTDTGDAIPLGYLKLPYDYIIFEEGGVIKAINSTGGIDFSDGDAFYVFQSVLDKLSGGGGIVLVKRGDYQLSDTLKIGSYTSLIGEGRLTVLRGPGGKPVIQNKDSTNGNVGIKLKGLYLDGNKESYTPSSPTWEDNFSSVLMIKVSHSVFEELWVRGGGMYASGSSDLSSRYNRGCGLMLTDGSSWNKIIKVHAFENDYDGIRIQYKSYSNIVTNCTCEDNKGSGIQVIGWYHSVEADAESMYNVISNNVISNTIDHSQPYVTWTRGIVSHNGKRNIIANNYINNVGKGVLILDYSLSIQVTGNQIINCDSGIEMLNGYPYCQANSLCSNSIILCTYGVLIDDDDYKNWINFNILNACDTGIQLSSPTHDNWVYYNFLKDCTTTINDLGTNNNVYGNVT